MYVTNGMLNKRKELDCTCITFDRKYYKVGQTFIKRSLRPSEWQISPMKGVIHVPRQGTERLRNEAAALQYVAAKTNVPVPKLHCCFEDDGAVYLITEYIDGVTMDDLNEDDRHVVSTELQTHIATLHNLHSSVIGGPSENLVIPPYRVTARSPREEWNLKPYKSDVEGKELVFCHNDLLMQNVIVDPRTLKINAIIDWEYAGFYPEFFERQFFHRLGPSFALEGENDDVGELLAFLNSHLVT